MTTTAPATTPTPGLLASLGVRIWADHGPDGSQFAALLLTHPPARRRGESDEQIERDMQIVADALGALPCEAQLPFVGDRVALRDGGLMIVRLDGAGHVLRVRKLERLAPMLDALGQVVIVVGLDPLDPLAYGDEIDRYIEHTGAANRLRCALAGVDVRRTGPLP